MCQMGRTEVYSEDMVWPMISQSGQWHCDRWRGRTIKCEDVVWQEPSEADGTVADTEDGVVRVRLVASD